MRPDRRAPAWSHPPRSGPRFRRQFKRGNPSGPIEVVDEVASWHLRAMAASTPPASAVYGGDAVARHGLCCFASGRGRAARTGSPRTCSLRIHYARSAGIGRSGDRGASGSQPACERHRHAAEYSCHVARSNPHRYRRGRQRVRDRAGSRSRASEGVDPPYPRCVAVSPSCHGMPNMCACCATSLNVTLQRPRRALLRRSCGGCS
jgi:hypothetical protein